MSLLSNNSDTNVNQQLWKQHRLGNMKTMSFLKSRYFWIVQTSFSASEILLLLLLLLTYLHLPPQSTFGSVRPYPLLLLLRTILNFFFHDRETSQARLVRMLRDTRRLTTFLVFINAYNFFITIKSCIKSFLWQSLFVYLCDKCHIIVVKLISLWYLYLKRTAMMMPWCPGYHQS